MFNVCLFAQRVGPAYNCVFFCCLNTLIYRRLTDWSKKKLNNLWSF